MSEVVTVGALASGTVVLRPYVLRSYPEGGANFGVPLSSFLGWAIIAGYLWAADASAPPRASARLGAGLYCGVCLFSWILTLWIGEPTLAAAGFLVHGALFLVLYSWFAPHVVVRAEALGGWGNEAGPVEAEGPSFTS